MTQQPNTGNISENSAVEVVSLERKNSYALSLVAPVVMPASGDLDLRSTERILETATTTFAERDFKTTAQLLERALPSLDRLYSHNEAAKLRALKMLRDCYLALSRAIEAKDCAEVGLSVFEDVMNKSEKGGSSMGIGDPSAFTRPVVKKLKTLRRSKDSEYLRRRAMDVSEKWAIFCRLG